MIRLAVFDCDGTLVDSAATICAAMERAFAAFAEPWPGPESTRRIIGLSLTNAVTELLPGVDGTLIAGIAKAYKGAFQQMRDEGIADGPLFPGALDALGAIEARGWLLGIATGKSDRGLVKLLEHHGLHARFVTLQTADRHPSKPHPSMLHQAARDAGTDALAMIGDTSFDMLMAVAAGADPIGVAWGYHPADELRAAGARAVAACFADLPALLDAA